MTAIHIHEIEKHNKKNNFHHILRQNTLKYPDSGLRAIWNNPNIHLHDDSPPYISAILSLFRPRPLPVPTGQGNAT